MAGHLARHGIGGLEINMYFNNSGRGPHTTVAVGGVTMQIYGQVNIQYQYHDRNTSYSIAYSSINNGGYRAVDYQNNRHDNRRGYPNQGRNTHHRNRRHQRAIEPPPTPAPMDHSRNRSHNWNRNRNRHQNRTRDQALLSVQQQPVNLNAAQNAVPAEVYQPPVPANSHPPMGFIEPELESASVEPGVGTHYQLEPERNIGEVQRTSASVLTGNDLAPVVPKAETVAAADVYIKPEPGLEKHTTVNEAKVDPVYIKREPGVESNVGVVRTADTKTAVDSQGDQVEG